MPGLLNNAQASGMDNVDMQAPRQAASEQEQGFYKRFVENGMKLIHSEKDMDALLNLIDSGNPVEGLGNAVVSVLTRVVDTAKAKGVEVPREAIMQGGSEFLAEMAELAEAADIHAFEKDELSAALQFGLELYIAMDNEKQGGQPPGPAGAPPAGAGAGAAPPERFARGLLAPTPQRGGM